MKISCELVYKGNGIILNDKKGDVSQKAFYMCDSLKISNTNPTVALSWKLVENMVKKLWQSFEESILKRKDAIRLIHDKWIRCLVIHIYTFSTVAFNCRYILFMTIDAKSYTVIWIAFACVTAWLLATLISKTGPKISLKLFK